MKTLHSLHGVTGYQAEGYNNMVALIENRIDIYGLSISQHHVGELANTIANISSITNNPNMVLCTTDRTLGDYGIACVGGIRAAYNTDVYSTREQRQEVAHLDELKLDAHVASDLYPEYWISNPFIQYVWVKEGREEFNNALSQLVGMLLGLNVVIYN